MTDDITRVSINISTGTIEISGSEAFVKEQLGVLQPWVEKMSEKVRAQPKKAETPHEEQPEANTPPGDYPNVFEIHDGKVNIVATLPGTTVKQKTVNAALITAFAKGANAFIPFDEIKDICSTHGCYNASHHSSYLKSAPSYFVFQGQSLKLTQPGKTKAKELVESLK